MKRILLHCLASLGDVIMSTSIVPIVRQIWPEAHVAMLVKSASAAAVENNPLIDEVISYGYKSRSLNAKATWELWRRLHNRFDLSISLDRHRRGILLCRLAGIQERVGPTFVYNSEPDKAWSRRLYTCRIEPRLDPDLDARIELIKDVVRQYAGRPEADGRPFLNPPGPEHFAKACALLDTMPSGRTVGLCLQGNLPIRSWPPERFSQLIDLLADKIGARAFIFGTAAQRPRAEQVAVASRRGAANFCGQTNLPELAALMLSAGALVTLDTGSAHMAAALNVPQVTLFGSSTPRRFRPVCAAAEAEIFNRSLWSGRDCSPCVWFNPEECPNGLACFNDLTAEDVLAQLQELFTLTDRT